MNTIIFTFKSLNLSSIFNNTSITHKDIEATINKTFSILASLFLKKKLMTFNIQSSHSTSIIQNEALTEENGKKTDPSPFCHNSFLLKNLWQDLKPFSSIPCIPEGMM